MVPPFTLKGYNVLQAARPRKGVKRKKQRQVAATSLRKIQKWGGDAVRLRRVPCVFGR